MQIRNKRIPEIKLKLLGIKKIIDDSLDSIFAASTPGYYNNAIGRKRGEKWSKTLEKKTTLQTLTLGPLVLIFGGYMLGQNIHEFLRGIYCLEHHNCNIRRLETTI